MFDPIRPLHYFQQRPFTNPPSPLFFLLFSHPPHSRPIKLLLEKARLTVTRASVYQNMIKLLTSRNKVVIRNLWITILVAYAFPHTHTKKKKQDAFYRHSTICNTKFCVYIHLSKYMTTQNSYMYNLISKLTGI